MPLLRIFLDASVVLSGLASPTGGSGKLFEAARRHKLKLLTTPLVVQEVARNLKKLAIELDQLEGLLSTQVIRLTADPSAEMIKKFSQISPDPDDAHILAGAGLSGVDVLVSLDKKHILIPEVRKALKPMLVKSPKGLWRWLKKSRE